MLSEKEKTMLNTPLNERDADLSDNLEIQDAVDIISLHSERMTSTDDETVFITLNEITGIILDAFMLGYSRGLEDKN